MKKSFLIFLFVSFSFLSYSQQFKWEKPVDSICQNNFYLIDIDKDVLSKLNNEFNDVKIIDEEQKEVPFLMKKESFSVSKRVFKSYKIKEKIHWKNGATVLIIENNGAQKINNLQLQIKNFDVRKHLELSGSDDYKNWYTIKENYTFRSANGLQTTSEIKSLNFPYVDYKYYRIVIFDCYSLPINVLKIGYYDTYQEEGKFSQIAVPTLTRFDSVSNKQTYIRVRYKETPYLDKLILNIAKPKYYYRNARICLQHHNKKGQVYYETIKQLVLDANSDLTFYMDEFAERDFYIVIDNEDNPPLEQVTVSAYQLNRHLVAYLEQGKQYSLVFGNKKMLYPPNYDIAHFMDEIPKDISTIKTGGLKEITHQKKKKVKSSTLWMWGAIAFVAILLGYLSYKMITEMESS